MNIQLIAKRILIMALAFFSISGAGIVFAQPTTPPTGPAGVPYPLHVGSDPQVKQGNLTVNGTVTGGTISAPSLCLGGSCQSSWPSTSSLQTLPVNFHSHLGGVSCYASDYGPRPINYIWYGVTYSGTSSTMSWCPTKFSGAVSVTIPGLAGRTIIGRENLHVWCRGSNSNWAGWGYDFQTIANDSYYFYRQKANITSIINQGGDSVSIGFECDFAWNNSLYVYQLFSFEGEVIVSS